MKTVRNAIFRFGIITMIMCEYFVCHSQNNKTINCVFAESDFNYIIKDKILTITSDFYDIEHSLDTIYPLLPYINISVLLDNNTEFKGFTHTFTDSLVMENIILANNMQDIITNDIISSDTISYNLKTYPNNIVSYTGTSIINGNKIASFIVSPFCYDAEQKKLYLNSDINIIIEQQNVQNNETTILLNETTRKTLNNIIINSYDINSEITDFQSIDYEYLIITVDSLKHAFEPLSNWKTTKGVKATVLTIEDINNNYSEDTLPLRIKKAIKDYYDGQNCGLKYVLLGGDTDIVPAQVSILKYNSKQGETPSDIFYACFDTMDWDNNGNGIYGELQDSIDLAPEIIVSRVSVSNINQTEDIVNRIIQYEQCPQIENWDDNILMCGALIDNNKKNDAKSDAHIYGENTYINYIQPYWHGRLVRLYDTGSDFLGDADYDFTPEHIQLELSKGYTIVDINTHGGRTGIVTESGAYLSADASLLSNSGCSVIICGACLTNDFDEQSPSFSEIFMRNSNSGILAYVGSSHYGWHPSSSNLHRKLYKSLFTSDTKRLSQSLYDAKNSYIGLFNSYTTQRWLALSINLLGDPEMSVWTQVPDVYSDAEISVNRMDNSIYATGYGVGDCFVSAHTPEGNVYKYEMENNGGVNMAISPNSAIMIYRQNMIPYFPPLLIQNQTYTKSQYLFASSVQIGKFVDSERSFSGDVIFSNGVDFVIDATEDVLIDDGFVVESGASVTIRTKGRANIKGGLVKAGGKLSIESLETVIKSPFIAENGAEIEFNNL